MDINWTYCVIISQYIPIYQIMFTSKTNTVLYVSYISIKKETEKVGD